MNNMKFKYDKNKLDELFQEAKEEIDLRENAQYYLYALMRLALFPALDITKMRRYLDDINIDVDVDDSIKRVMSHDLEIFLDEVEQQLGFEADARRQEALEDGI